MVLGLGLGPQRSHQRHVLTHDLSTIFEVLAVIGELLAIPSEPHSQGEPSVGHMVERGNRLGQSDRIVLGNEGNARGNPQRGLRGNECESDIWIGELGVCIR